MDIILCTYQRTVQNCKGMLNLIRFWSNSSYHILICMMCCVFFFTDICISPLYWSHPLRGHAPSLCSTYKAVRPTSIFPKVSYNCGWKFCSLVERSHNARPKPKSYQNWIKEFRACTVISVCFWFVISSVNLLLVFCLPLDFFPFFLGGQYRVAHKKWNGILPSICGCND